MTGKYRIFVLLIIGAIAFVILGLNEEFFDTPFIDDGGYVGGKIDKKNPLAPKKITSKNLVYFYSDFFLSPNENDEYQKPRSYIFKVETDEKTGKIILSETYYRNISCETDEEIFTKLQNIIEKYNLSSLNGIIFYTEGLPPEYEPAVLTAKYASGEKLDFAIENNPYSDWTREIMQLLMAELETHGKVDLPGKEKIEFIDISDNDVELKKEETFLARLFTNEDYMKSNYKMEDFRDEDFTIWLNYVSKDVSKENNMAIPYKINPNGNEKRLTKLFNDYNENKYQGEPVWRFITDEDGKIVDAYFYQWYDVYFD